MVTKLLKYTCIASAAVILFFPFHSCISPKKVVYLNDLSDSLSGNLGAAKLNFETLIQKNDQLQITVAGSNLADLPVFNNSGLVMGGGQVMTLTGAIGYLVEADGKIELPYLGRIRAEGLTRLQLQDSLATLLKDYTKNPAVTIKFLNYGVSVLGEVPRPGRITMLNERMTLLDALAQAGDVGIFGRNDNVMVIREEEGKRQFAQLNLLNSRLYQSPYFYLRNNDVVYVEPLPAKYISRKGIPQYVGIISVGLSLILTTINIVIVSRR